jgi:hypothetical protein
LPLAGEEFFIANFFADFSELLKFAGVKKWTVV